jgi:hypothetical protein
MKRVAFMVSLSLVAATIACLTRFPAGPLAMAAIEVREAVLEEGGRRAQRGAG